MGEVGISGGCATEVPPEAPYYTDPVTGQTFTQEEYHGIQNNLMSGNQQVATPDIASVNFGDYNLNAGSMNSNADFFLGEDDWNIPGQT